MNPDTNAQLSAQDITPLIEWLRQAGPPLDARTVRAITGLPLSADAWVATGEALVELLDADPTTDLLASAAAVPVVQVRERVRARMASSSGHARLILAGALARVRDDACREVLTASLATVTASDQPAVAEALSFVAPANAAPAREAFEQTESDDVRLWLALHLARAGDESPITTVMEDAAAGRFDPELYHGDPNIAAAAIHARAPLPDLVIDLAAAHSDPPTMLIEHLAAAPPAATRPASGPPASDADVATAVRTIARLSLPKPPSWDEATADRWMLAVTELQPLLAAVPDRLVEAIVEHIVLGTPPIAVGNFMIDLVAAQPEFRPDVDSLFEAYLRLHDRDAVASQVAWVASRAPLADIVRRAAGDIVEQPRGALDFLSDVGRSIRAPYGPILGGATVSIDEPVVVDLISLEKPTAAAPPAVDAPAAAPVSDDLGLESLPSAPAPATDVPAAAPLPDGLESLPSAPGDAPQPDAPQEPSDHVYALLECLPTAPPEVEFELAVGLSPAPSEGVLGGPLEGLGGRPKPYIISVQVVADGFELRDGERWRHDLAVTEDQPYPSVALHLIPDLTSKPVWSAPISATYTVDGQMVGMAVRSIAVVAHDATAPDDTDTEVAGADISIPTGPVPADLTVALHETRELHLYRLTIESPHPSVPIPTVDVEVDIGASPADYARDLVRSMDGLEGKPQLRRDLKGRGRLLKERLPQEFWDALYAAAAAAEGTPSLLLVSAEGRIPWELALVEPPLDPGAPEFLSTQTVMGRWVLGNTPLPPPHEHEGRDMVVVTGDYTDLARWESLQAAFEERDHLQATYSAEPIEANYPDVTAALSRDPVPAVLHMAVHGKYNGGLDSEGLVLTDGLWLTPNVVMAEKLAGRPFVFLNACQVGSGSDVLHQYSGMAAAFLAVGASGVIAPLWSVKDDIAREIAVGFYAATIDEGLSVGEAIRRERVAFGNDSEAPTSATFMAYQYFGHPELKLAATERGET